MANATRSTLMRKKKAELVDMLLASQARGLELQDELNQIADELENSRRVDERSAEKIETASVPADKQASLRITVASALALGFLAFFIVLLCAIP